MKAIAMRTIRTTPADSATERKSPSGMSGSATRFSQYANSAKPSTEMARNDHVMASPQPHSEP